MDVSQKIADTISEMLEEGVAFPVLQSYLKKEGIALKIFNHEKYGLLLAYTVNVLIKKGSGKMESWDDLDVYSEKQYVIHPGSSWKKAFEQSEESDAKAFFDSQVNRIVVKSFTRPDGKGESYRYYLKKFKNS